MARVYNRYDQEFLKTPEGNNLWLKWRNARPVCSEWRNFEVFKEWALRNGFSLETILKKYNRDLPHSPDNSYFHPAKRRASNTVTEEQAKKWDQTVNRIRVHCGMKPLGVNEEIEDAERTGQEDNSGIG